MSHKIHSSERRGIIAVAGIALTVTALGMMVAWCDRPVRPPDPVDVRIIAYGDSAMILSADSMAKIASLPDSVRLQLRINESRKAALRKDSLRKEAQKKRKQKRDSLKRTRKSSPSPKKQKNAPSLRSPLDDRI